MKINEPSDNAITKEGSENNPVISPGEIIIGTLVSLNDQGQPLVDFPQNLSAPAVAAISTLEITQANVGRQVALLFANGVLERPVIMGMIHAPLQSILENHVSYNDNAVEKDEFESDGVGADEVGKTTDIDDVLLDGNKLVFEAKEEIVLKCGESSITLTKSGKILIRGKYLLNRSTGVNRIMGGSVQVN